MCREIIISEVIDSSYEEQSADQIVSNGKALEAMILNGLGFVNKRLYLILQFYEDKPVDILLGGGFEAGHFNDDRAVCAGCLLRQPTTAYRPGAPAWVSFSNRTFLALEMLTFMVVHFLS